MHDDNPQTTCTPATLQDQPSSNPTPPCQVTFYSSNPHHHDMFIYDEPVHKQERGEETSNSQSIRRSRGHDEKKVAHSKQQVRHNSRM
jgi:hypothetical protein